MTLKWQTLLVNVDELWLKGKNRSFYFTTLKRHIYNRLSLEDLKFKSSLKNERFVIEAIEGDFKIHHIEALQKIPGIHSILPCRCCTPVMEEIEKEAIGLIGEEIEQGFSGTFKVNTKRVDKSFPSSSMDTSRHLGASILLRFDQLKVEVKKPMLNLAIKILYDRAYVSAKSYLGVGGLPVGTSGHLLSLLSGGIDSPVSSFLMARRGAKQTFLFFHAYPFVGNEVLDKIQKLASILGQGQNSAKLLIFPFGEIQKFIGKFGRVEYRTLLFRLYMLRSAENIAETIKAKAIVTGDSLGQVSSQTLENILCLDKLIDHSIFRPLIGFNKIEVVQWAQNIGTYETSILPHDDACSLFAPKKPVIKADMDYLTEFDANYGAQIMDLIKKVQLKSFRISPNGMLDEMS